MNSVNARCPVCATELLSTEGLCPACLVAAHAPADNEPRLTATLCKGSMLGPYEIVSPAGEGGMGQVYRARDSRLGRDVAIKVLPARVAADARARRRLEREARIIAGLNHPHICALHDIGEHEGTAFLVMEYLEGPTLAKRLEEGWLPLDQILCYGIQIADALDKAHRQGIVHRDLKPSNVILTKSGAVLLDFGLAKLNPITPIAAFAEPSPDSLDQSISGSRTFAGTIQYTSPEQLEGKEADSRSDLFSFGLVLYEMISGRRAFAAETDAGLMAAVLSSEPAPVSTLRPGLPPALDRLVQNCLAKDPENRWQSAHDVLLQLKSLLEEDGSGVDARSPVPGRTLLLVAVTTLVAITSGVGVEPRGGQSPRVYAEVARFTLSPPRPPGLAEIGSSVAVVSPDGRRLAWRLSSADAKTSLAVQELDSTKVLYLDETEGARHPFWSPDSAEIGFFAGGQLKRVRASGGPVESVTSVPLGAGGTWNRAGTIVFAPDANGVLQKVSMNGGRVMPVTSLDHKAGESAHQWPWFLPDGRHIVYLALGAHAELPALYLADTETSQRRYLARADSGAIYVAGYLLYVRGRTLMALPFDVDRLQIAGPQVVVQRDVHAAYTVGRRFFSASDNGILIYHTLRMRQSQLAWFDRQGRWLGSAGAAETYRNPLLSPDGRYVAAQRPGIDGGPSSLHIIDLTRGTAARVTEISPATAPVWSPDSATLAFASNYGGRHQLYTVPAHGGTEERLEEQLTQTTADMLATDWSADGRFLLYEQLEAEGTSDLRVLPLFGDRRPTPYLRTRHNERQGRFSPNTKFVAYSSDESGRFEVYVQPLPATGVKWQISSDGGSQPSWRKDGRELFYLSTSRSVAAVSVATDGGRFQAGRPRILFELPSRVSPAVRSSYSSALNGTRFLVNIDASQDSASPNLVPHLLLNLHAMLESSASTSVIAAATRGVASEREEHN